MVDSKYNNLIVHGLKGFKTPALDVDLLSKNMQVIDNTDYVEFIREYNGGFFFNAALHLYGYSNKFEYYYASNVNSILNQAYGDRVKNLYSFGQNLFGNQFAFDLTTKEVVYFDIESTEVEILSQNFRQWYRLVCDGV